MEGQTLHAALDKVAAEQPGVALSFPADGVELSLSRLSLESRQLAGRLRRLGIRNGERVASLCQNEPDFLLLLFAVSRLGACLCPLSMPTGSLEAFSIKARAVLGDAGITTVMLSSQVGRMPEAIREPLAGYRQISLADCWPEARLADEQVLGEEIDGGHEVVLQYTSGSTSLPKGVQLTHDNVLACLRAIVAGMDVTAGDRLAMWLPFFHDMGLFSTLSMALSAVPVTVWQPSYFVRNPARWLRDFADGRHTIGVLPNFGFDYLVQAVPAETAADYDLSRWRIAFNGAEQIAVESVEAFVEHFAPSGFRPGAMFPVYGLAEATLAATFPPVGRCPVFDWVDRSRLSEQGLATPADPRQPGARAVANVGRPVLGMELRIADPATGAVLAERLVGEVQLRGPSVTAGYLAEAAALEQPFSPDGWLRTGDLGYLVDGELHVTGRLKEMILLRGENYYPEDVESAVRSDPGVYRRHCVAFVHAGGGREQMVLLAETGRSAAEHAELADHLRTLVRGAVGLDDLVVVLAKRGAIPRTSSGKLQRLVAKHDFAKADADKEEASHAHA